VTIHDEHSIESLFHRYQDRGLTELVRDLDAETGVLQQDYAFFYVGADPWTLVFYDSRYLIEKWSRMMAVESMTPEAMDYQTAIVLRKRPQREPSKST